ncbi:hypothetical protein M2281_005554 [Mesorhizobium soli]|nr:hypothetical protein [Mesorhizobium soli]
MSHRLFAARKSHEFVGGYAPASMASEAGETARIILTGSVVLIGLRLSFRLSLVVYCGLIVWHGILVRW